MRFQPPDEPTAQRPLSESDDRAYAAGFLLLLLLSLVLRLVVLASEISSLQADEAYYWEWSRRPDWSYFSKGPMVAYLIHLGTLLGGHDPFFVRLPAVLGAIGAAAAIFSLGRSMFGNARTGFWTMLVFLGTPLLTAGSMLMTIDNPLFLFWSLTVLSTWHAVSSGRPGWWLAAGLCFGLGIMAKAVIVFYIPSLILLLVLSPEGRRQLRSPGPWCAILLGLLFFAPQLYWNSRHDWPMFRDFLHKGGEGGAFSLKPLHLPRLIGSQIGVLFPLGTALVVVGLVQGWRRGIRERDPVHLFVFCMAIPVLAFYTVLSLRTKIGTNWPVIGYLTPMLAGVSAWRNYKFQPGSRPWVRRLAVAGLLLGLFVCHLLVLIPAGGLARLGLPVKYDITRRIFGWDRLGEHLNTTLADRDPSAPTPFLAGVKYQVCAELAFYVEGNPETLCFTKRGASNQYYYWNDFTKHIGRTALFVGEDSDDIDKVRHAFGSILTVTKLELRKREDVSTISSRTDIDPETNPDLTTGNAESPGDVLRTFYIWECSDFKGWKFK